MAQGLLKILLSAFFILGAIHLSPDKNSFLQGRKEIVYFFEKLSAAASTTDIPHI